MPRSTLIDHSNPRITPHFDPEPPLFLPAALSLSDIRLFDANFAPTDGYCLLLIAEGRGFLEITKNTAQNITQDGTDHNNFDHHSHSTEVSACELWPVKIPVNPFVFIDDFDIPAGSTEFKTSQIISIPTSNGNGEFDEGDYHFFISLTDKEGWSTQKGLSIKIIKRK